MTKKYVVVCLCVLAVCAVLGLTARTDYVYIKRGIEHVAQTADVIVDDVTIVDCFAYIFEDFRLGQKTETKYYGYTESEFMGTGYIVGVSKNPGTHTSESGTVHGGGGTRYFAFQTEETAMQVLNALEPLTWNLSADNPDSFWGNILNGVTSAINAVTLILGIIFTLLQTIFIFVTDAIATAWSLVEMALYIMGFPVTV